MINEILKLVQIGDSLGTGIKDSTRNEYGRPSVGGTATDNFINPFWGSGWTRINQLGSSLISPSDKAWSGLSWLGGPLTQSLFDEYINKKMDKIAYKQQTTFNSSINAPLREIGTSSGKSQLMDVNSKKVINPAIKQYYEDEQKIRGIGTSIIGGASTLTDTGLLDGISLDGATATQGRADRRAIKASPKPPKEATFDDTASLFNSTSGNKLFDAGTGMDFYAAKGGKNMNKSKEVVAGEAGKEWLVDIKTGKVIEELAQGAEKINLKPGTAVINQEQMARIQAGEPFESVIASLPNVQNVDKAANGVQDPPGQPFFNPHTGWIDISQISNLFSSLWTPSNTNIDANRKKAKEAFLNNRSTANEVSLVQPSTTKASIANPSLSTSLNKNASQSYSKSATKINSLSNNSSNVSESTTEEGRKLTFADAPITGNPIVRMNPKTFNTDKGLISGIRPTELVKTKFNFGTSPKKKDSWFKTTMGKMGGEEAVLAANTLYNTLAAIENSKEVEDTPISNVPLAKPAMVSASKVNAEPLLRMQSRAFNTALAKAVKSGKTELIPLIMAANSNALQTVNESVSGRNAELENAVRGTNAASSNQFSLARFQTGQDVEAKNKLMERENNLINFSRKGESIGSLANLLYGAGQYKLSKRARKDYEREMDIYQNMLKWNMISG